MVLSPVAVETESPAGQMVRVGDSIVVHSEWSLNLLHGILGDSEAFMVEYAQEVRQRLSAEGIDATWDRLASQWKLADRSFPSQDILAMDLVFDVVGLSQQDPDNPGTFQEAAVIPWVVVLVAVSAVSLIAVALVWGFEVRRTVSHLDQHSASAELLFDSLGTLAVGAVLLGAFILLLRVSK